MDEVAVGRPLLVHGRGPEVFHIMREMTGAVFGES